jgi:geranylgeranyl pyrophosphate synthase
MALDNALQAVDDLLLSVVDSPVPVLREASQHILGAGGKRLRPRVVLLSYSAAGGQKLHDAVPLAAAIEIIHTATLVHDDINDHGTLRRGRETVNAHWGRTFALLTGDYMFAKAYQLMLPYSNDLNAILANAAVELVEGETLQILAAKEGSLSRDTYFEIIAKKTASLFAASAMLGSTAARATQAWTSALRHYAFNLGLAFQITDDVLDLVADSKQLGKDAGIDVAQGRGIAVALGGSRSGNNVATVDVEGPLDGLRQGLVGAHELDRAIQKGRETATELALQATDHLRSLPPSPALDGLHALARLVIDRDH